MASFPGSGAAPATAPTGIKKYFNKSCGKWCTQCPFFRLSGGGGGHSHAGRPGLPVGAVVMAQIKIDKADRTEQRLMIAGAAFAYFCTPGCGITNKRKKEKQGKGLRCSPPKKAVLLNRCFPVKGIFYHHHMNTEGGPNAKQRLMEDARNAFFCTDTREL